MYGNYGIKKMKRLLNILSKKQLESLNTKRLLMVLKSARAVESGILYHHGPRCCEICHEYIGDDYENDVLRVARPITEYKNLIKEVLSKREHCKSKN